MRTVFARLGCQVGSLLFRPLLVQTCHRPLPRRGPAIVPVRTAVCCLRRDMSGSALPNTFRLIICRGCSVHLILRPACLLPSFSKALDAPLWPVASLPSAGACYRALRRLPGQVLSLLEERVFQDARCFNDRRYRREAAGRSVPACVRQLSQQDDDQVPTDDGGKPVIQEDHHARPFELQGQGHQQDGNDLGDQ